jgi:hypothetical protein
MTMKRYYTNDNIDEARWGEKQERIISRTTRPKTSASRLHRRYSLRLLEVRLKHALVPEPAIAYDPMDMKEQYWVSRREVV